MVLSASRAGVEYLDELITYAGNWESITILCLLLLIFEKTRVPYGIPVAATAIGTTVIKSIVKPIVARPRPDVAMQLISEGGYSFPSGHAITSIAVYGLLIFLVHQYMEDRKKAMGLTIVLGILAVGIGLSRIYLGVHYLTDVVGGWSAGIAVMVTVMMINQHISAKKQQI
ncbi:MAG: phosphatase PAP2 family protein [Anaerovoracaceae bacterium]